MTRSASFLRKSLSGSILGILILLLFSFCSVRECGGQEEDEYTREWSRKCDEYLAAWRNGGKGDAKLAGDLLLAARRGDRVEVIEEVAAGGDVEGKKIPLGKPARVTLEVLRRFGKIPHAPYTENPVCVARRITPDRFELWTPKRGWLFNAQGKLINTAKPPRRDGMGREWFGAFGADGSWITTDLWDYDCTVTFFSPRGKWRKELTAMELAPLPSGKEWRGPISWARADRAGTGWVIAVGSEGGREIVHVSEDGAVRSLGRKSPASQDDIFCPEAWKLCYPRDLRAKGGFNDLFVLSDDGEDWIRRGGAGHGEGVGYPWYALSDGKSEVMLANRDYNFGFLPDSRNVFIGSTYEAYEKPDRRKTWFFDPGLACLGWIEASYLADAPDGAGVWMLDDDDCVTQLARDLKPIAGMQFVAGKGKAKPVKLFTDLRLGFFEVNGSVVLARWRK